MEEFKKAYKKGLAIRIKQDEVLTLFLKHIQQVTDMDKLEAIKQQLEGGIQ